MVYSIGVYAQVHERIVERVFLFVISCYPRQRGDEAYQYIRLNQKITIKHGSLTGPGHGVHIPILPKEYILPAKLLLFVPGDHVRSIYVWLGHA